MKKLMIAAAIVCAAAMSQAATANWSAPFVFNSAQTIDTVEAVSYAWAIVEGATAADLSNFKFENGELSGGSAFLTGPNITVQAFGQEMAGELTGATAGKYYGLLVYDGDSKLWGLSNAVLGTADPTDDTKLLAIEFTNGNDPFGQGIPSMVANQASAVPEPTSGLLLLLGVAGLALRRRRA